ncbi:MAG: DUF2490 domain-containing protein [Bacteriovoracaceae bacterium]
MKKVFLLLLFLFVPTTYGKNVTTTGAVSFLSLSKSLSPFSAINFYHYDIYGIGTKHFKGKDYNSGLALTYFQTSYSYQYLPNLQLAGGYIFQENNPFEDHPEKENRIFEQFILSHLTNWFAVTHRIRFEQRFIDKESGSEFKTRVRYQIGGRRALRGVEIDPDEIYLNAYNEFYFSTTGERNAFYSDNWTFIGFGYMTKNWGAIEAGPLIQWSVINKDKDTRTNYTLQAGWIFRF